MTRNSCPSCRLRFTRVTASHLAACPFCAQPLQSVPAADLLGYRLLSIEPLLAQEPAGVQRLDADAADAAERLRARPRPRADA